MDEFIELPTDDAENAASEYRYRLVEPLRRVLEFYALWDRTVLLNDWDAYREMISEKFPNEWTDPAPPNFYFDDESLIPSEFIMYPLDMDDEPERRHKLRAILAPDEYGIAAWLAAEAEKA